MIGEVVKSNSVGQSSTDEKKNAFLLVFILWSDESKLNCLAIMITVVFGGERGRLAS